MFTSCEKQSGYLPLLVKQCVGGAFHATSHLSNLVTDNKHTFASIYPQSSFIFESQLEQPMIIDSFTVGSDFNSRLGAFPVGQGIIFTGNNLWELEALTHPFHEFSESDYRAY